MTESSSSPTKKETLPEFTEEGLKEWLKPVEDPELFLSIVELGLIYNCEIQNDDHVHVKMTLTTPACPAGDYLVQEVHDRAMEHPNVKSVTVELVWEPKWDPVEMASEECKEVLGIW